MAIHRFVCYFVNNTNVVGHNRYILSNSVVSVSSKTHSTHSYNSLNEVDMSLNVRQKVHLLTPVLADDIRWPILQKRYVMCTLGVKATCNLISGLRGNEIWNLRSKNSKPLILVYCEWFCFPHSVRKVFANVPCIFEHIHPSNIHGDHDQNNPVMDTGQCVIKQMLEYNIKGDTVYERSC